MADEKKTASDQEFLEDGKTPNPDYKKPTDAGEGGEPAEPPKTEAGEGEEPEVPIRHSASQIITRQKRTIKKLRSKKDEDADADFQPPTGGEGDGDDKLSPEAKTAVTQEVQRQVGPLMDTMANKSDEDELQALFTGPDGKTAKPYEKKIRVYMKVHPTVTPEMIFHHLHFGEAETAVTKKKKAADADAAHQRGGGAGIEPTTPEEGGVPSIEEQNEMSDEDFDKLKDKALQGGFKPEGE